jgi:hypothetical protein
VQKSDKQNATVLADDTTFKPRQRCISDRSVLLFGVCTADRIQPHVFQWSHTDYTDSMHNHWKAGKYSFIIKLVTVTCNYLHRMPIYEDKLYTRFLFTIKGEN